MVNATLVFSPAHMTLRPKKESVRLFLVGPPNSVTVWLRVASLPKVVDPPVLTSSSGRRAGVSSAQQQVTLPMISMLPVVVRRGGDLIHHRL